MGWVSGNLPLIGDLTLEHLYFALPPIVIGLVLAIPLGWLANRTRAGRTVAINLSGLLYTIPSLALFVLLPPLLDTRILDPINVIVALTVYTVALLVRPSRSRGVEHQPRHGRCGDRLRRSGKDVHRRVPARDPG